MSLEKEVGRLADALERIADRFEKLESVAIRKSGDEPQAETKKEEAPKKTAKKTAKKAAKKKTAKKSDGPSLEDIRALCNEVATTLDKKVVMDELSRLGVKKLTDLEEDQFGELEKNLRKALEEADEEDEEEDDADDVF